MKRKVIWRVISGISVLFIILQACTWLGVGNISNNTLDKTILQSFLTTCEQHGLLLFLIDTVILEHILSAHTENVKCYILCDKGYNNVTFGLKGDTVAERPQMFDFIDSYLSQCIYSKLPRSDIRIREVPVHCWLQSPDITIHVVIFYNISDTIWWHGSTGNKNQIYGATEGIHKRITTKEIELDGFHLRIPQNPQNFLIELQHSRFIPCDEARADQYFMQYGKDLTEQANTFHSEAVALIKKAKDVLDKLEVPFWLSSGTCLGWFRQCDIIPYSKDVDIGIFIEDYVASVVPSMVNAGLQLKHKFGKIEDSFELSFQADDLKLDIFFFYKEDTYIWNGGTQASTGNKYKYAFPKFTLCWTLFFSILVRIPCETVSYVQANYGVNWFVPVKNWDWKKSPPNVKPNGVWPMKERDRVINVYI